jgi:hypothetical protein
MGAWEEPRRLATLRLFLLNPANPIDGYESGNSRRPFWFADRCACLSCNPRAVLQSLGLGTDATQHCGRTHLGVKLFHCD